LIPAGPAQGNKGDQAPAQAIEITANGTASLSITHRKPIATLEF
jgi:hypothetical protein